MKVSLNMDSKLPQIVQEETTTKSPKMVKRAVIVLSAVVIVSTIVGLSVYFGMKMTRDTYNEAWQTFKTADGQKVEEKVTVKEKSVDIKVPNEMEVIYDYKNGLKVQRFVHHDTGLYGPCYAAYINDSVDPNPDEAAQNNEDGENDLPEGTEIERGQVKFTTNRVPSYMLSDDVKKMCSDTQVYWIENVPEGHSEEKRASCYYRLYVRVCYRRYYGAICRLYTLCYSSSYRYLYYTYITYKYYY